MHEILERLRRELADGVGGMSAEETQTRRGPKRWSVQQIVEHLLLSYAATREVVLVRVAKGTPTKASPTVSQRVGQFGIATLGLFPPGRLAPAAVEPAAMPARRMSGEELGAGVGEALAGMDVALAEAEALFGASRRCVSHLVLGPMSVRQWRRFHLVHGEHHLKQIKATNAKGMR